MCEHVKWITCSSQSKHQRWNLQSRCVGQTQKRQHKWKIIISDNDDMCENWMRKKIFTSCEMGIVDCTASAISCRLGICFKRIQMNAIVSAVILLCFSLNHPFPLKSNYRCMNNAFNFEFVQLEAILCYVWCVCGPRARTLFTDVADYKVSICLSWHKPIFSSKCDANVHLCWRRVTKAQFWLLQMSCIKSNLADNIVECFEIEDEIIFLPWIKLHLLSAMNARSFYSWVHIQLSLGTRVRSDVETDSV